MTRSELVTGVAAVQSSPRSAITVQDALQLMQQAVRKGQWQEAADIGAAAAVPLNIRVEDLAILGEIASGAEATVLYGNLHNSDVAVKRFKMHHSDDLKRFRRELSILASLAGHPNIVPLLGARALPPDYLIVMPLASTTLHSKLYQQGWRPGHVELLQLAVQAAEGLAAVHAKGLVHRDLKPSNMLLSYDGQLWLSDFGLAASAEEVLQESTLNVNMLRSRGKPTGGFLKKAMAGTLEYMAPEVLLKQPASQASDVYGLAIAINEIATGVYPFSNCTKDNPEIHTILEHGYGRQELAAAVAAEGLRPLLPQAAPAGLVELLQAAWSLDPAARPTAQQMRDKLAALMQQQLKQQEQHCVQHAEKPQQHKGEVVVIDGCCDGESLEDDTFAVMDMDTASTGTASEAAGQRLRQCTRYSTPGSSAAVSDAFTHEASTVPGSLVTLLPPQHPSSGAHHVSSRPAGQPQRIPRHSSASTLSTDAGVVTPCSTEVANAAAAAAATAAVPAAASLQGVLSKAAALAAESGAATAVEAGAFGAIGPRESMEDRHVVVQGLGGDQHVMLAAVFDGHRGFEAAAYAAGQLARNLLLASVQVVSKTPLQDSNSSEACQAQLTVASVHPAEDNSSDVAVALKQSFVSTDAGFWQEWQAEMHAHAATARSAERYPGCTALAAVVAGNQLFVANAGDGRAVLSRAGAAVPLSRQHTADLADERARVVAAGGTVTYRGGSWRVGPAALQVTRALGDFDLKMPGQHSGQHVVQQQPQYCPYRDVSGSDSASPAVNMPVTADPEVVSAQLLPSDQFLILGTDGLWDVMKDQEAVGLVHDTVKDPFLCAKRLVTEALSRGSSDNVSAVVVFLQPKDTLERVWKRGEGVAVPAATPTFYGSRRLTTQQLAEKAGVAPAAAPAGVTDEMMDTY